MPDLATREADTIHARLKAAVEVTERRCLWTEADAITFTPPLSSTIYGDGRALFAITTINNRPAYWIIRGDSGWSCDDLMAPDDVPEFGDFIDEILTDLEGEFGRARCGYSGANLYLPPEERGCDCEDCSDPEVAEWPMVDAEVGCSWRRLWWPASFDLVPHPWARTDLLALNKGPEG